MKILLIETDEVVARSLIDAFLKQGYACEHTSLGTDGVDVATRRFYAYDIIIIGSYLQDVTNVDALKLIRAAKVDTPITLIMDVHGKTIEALDSGADDCIVKPVNVHELMARMRAIMRRPKKYECEIINLGRLVIDQNNRQVKLDGRELHITKIEFALLEVLALRPGKLTRNESLIIHTAGYESMTVHIHRLRKKLGKEFISTVWGQGHILHKLEKP